MKTQLTAKTGAATGLALAFTVTLAGCGGGSEQSVDDMVADMQAQASANALSFDDGFDVCFEAAKSELGEDAMVSSVATLISSGSEIDSMQSYPRGTVTSCKVEFQSPDNPVKMMSMSYENDEGGFGEARELEITVIGGNASDYRVEDYVMRLGDVNIAGLGAYMDSKKGDLEGVYSDYAWSGIRLDAPGMTSPNHSLKATLTGRLAANDVKETGSVTMQTDGTSVIRDGLLPR